MSAPVLDKPSVTSSRSSNNVSPTSSAPFIAAILIILLGAIALVYFRGHQKLGEPGVKIAAVPLYDEKGKPITKLSIPMPEHVQDFKSEPISLTTAQLCALPGDTTYGRRTYFTDDGFRTAASVILMGSDRTSIHKPEFCLPGGGWHIQKKETDEIAINSPQPYKLPIQKWTVSQQTRAGIVDGLYVFWFVDDHEITREHSGRMISIAKNMFTRGELERWAYISYLVVCMPGQEDAAYAKVKKLIAASVPQFQLVSGASTASK